MEPELEGLSALYRRGVEEGGHTVLIEGAAGVGKSALLREYRRRSRLDGIAVLDGWCRSDRRTYQPILDIVRAASSYLSDVDPNQFDAPQSFRILRALVGSAAEGRPKSSEHWHDRRLGLYRSVGELLMGVSQIRPPVVIVHDLQLADEGSLSLLQYLVQTLSSSAELDWGKSGEKFRGLFVLSERDPQPESSGIASHLSGIAHTQVQLHGLDRTATRAYLDARDMVGQIHEITQGNPRKLEALLERLDPDADSLLAQRLEQADEPARTLVSALAVLGRPASVRVLGHLTGVGTAALDVAAEQLLTSKVVRSSVQDGELRLSFHSLADQETVLRRLQPSQLRQLYRAVAEAMLTRGEEVSAAEYLLRGQEGERAAEVVLRVGERLEIAFAYERAIDLYERTLKITTGELRSVLTERLCDLLTRVGRYNQAADIAGREQGPAAVDAAHPRRVVPLKWDNLGEVKTELEGALVHLDDTSQGGHGRATILADLAEVHYVEGRHQAAEEAVERVLAVKQPDTGAARLKARMTLGKVYLEQSRLEEAAELLEANLAESRHLGALHSEISSLINLGISHLRRGRTGAAQQCYQESLEAARASDNHRAQGVSLQNLGVLAQWRRDYTTALEHFQKAIGVFLQLGERTWLSWLALDLASLCLELGNDLRAAGMIELSSSLQETKAEAFTPLFARALRGRLAHHRGDDNTAEAHFTAVLEQSQEAGKENEVLIAKLDLAGLLLKQGRFAESESLARKVEAAAMPKLRAQALAIIGEGLLASEESYESAREAMTEALSLFEQVSDPRGSWMMLALLGELASRCGQEAEATELGERAAVLEGQICQRVPSEFLNDYLTLPRRQELLARIGQLGNKPIPAKPATSDAPAPPSEPPTPPVEEKPRRQTAHCERYPMIIGEHSAMSRLFGLMDRVAELDSDVLIRGESGTGKELVALAIHRNSPRRLQPYVKVNCGALVETLLLSELFGHERGAFTGATKRKQGRFERAGQGTLLLDEIGDISLPTQVALLRVLQEREFERVGGSRPIRINCRILFATNRDLEGLVQQGLFREDLYHRVTSIQMEVPPLRERRSDVPLLADHFLRLMSDQAGQPTKTLSASLLQQIINRPWSGNVRELDNFLRSASLFSEGEVIQTSDLHGLFFMEGPADAGPAHAQDPAVTSAPEPQPQAPADPDPFVTLQDRGVSLAEYKKEIEHACITRALSQSEGNITRAAALLGMNRASLSLYVKKHQLRAGARK